MLKRKLIELCYYLYRAFYMPVYKCLLEKKTNSIIKQNVQIYNGLVLEGRNFIGKSSYLDRVEIGYGSYLAEGCRLICTKIGKYTCIGNDVKVTTGQHPTSGFVSLHPAFYSRNTPCEFSYTDKDLFQEHRFADEKKKYFVEIGNDVWIGDNVRIMEGVHIGNGAVIGTGALVLNDVEPFSVNVGMPSHIVKYRFSSKQIGFLEQFKWWALSEEKLKEIQPLMTDIEKLMAKVQQDAR